MSNWVVANNVEPIIITGDNGVHVAKVYDKNNAHLIAAAPLGLELAEAIINSSATWIDEGLLEVGEGEYLHLKKLALEFKSKTENRGNAN